MGGTYTKLLYDSDVSNSIPDKYFETPLYNKTVYLLGLSELEMTNSRINLINLGIRKNSKIFMIERRRKYYFFQNNKCQYFSGISREELKNILKNYGKLSENEDFTFIFECDVNLRKGKRIMIYNHQMFKIFDYRYQNIIHIGKNLYYNLFIF